MVHIRGHLTEREWAWLKDRLELEQVLGDDESKYILGKISTNERGCNNGKLGTVAIQNGRV